LDDAIAKQKGSFSFWGSTLGLCLHRPRPSVALLTSGRIFPSPPFFAPTPFLFRGFCYLRASFLPRTPVYCSGLAVLSSWTAPLRDSPLLLHSSRLNLVSPCRTRERVRAPSMFFAPFPETFPLLLMAPDPHPPNSPTSPFFLMLYFFPQPDILYRLRRVRNFFPLFVMVPLPLAVESTC